MSDDVKALIWRANEFAGWLEPSEGQTAELIRELAEALEAKEREHPSNCNCGYGGFHEHENKNCEANQ